MIGSMRCWMRVGVVAVLIGGAGCREREPSPAFDANLGSETRPLLPTAPLQLNPELGTSNKKVELPERPESGAAARATAAADNTGEAAPAARDAGASGAAPPEGDATTNGAKAAAPAGSNGVEDAGTTGATP